MSEMASRISIDAEQQMRMLHELCAYRDAQQASGVIPTLRLRIGIITARDPATYTVSVLLGASDESDTPAGAIPGIRLVDTVYPEIGGKCLVSFNGPEPVVTSMLGGAVGRVRLRKSGTGALNHDVVSPIDFDLEDHDTDGLHTISQDTRCTIPWPGCYHLEACGRFDADPTGRRIIDIRLNGSTPVARAELPTATSSTSGPVLNCSTTMDLAYQDYLEMCAYQSSGGPLSLLNTGLFSPVFCVTWICAPETVAP